MPQIEKTNIIKTYAAAAATAVKTSPSMGQIKPTSPPQPSNLILLNWKLIY